MAHFFSHFAQGLLDYLGIDHRRQFAWMIVLLTAMFLGYAGTRFGRERFYSVTYLMLGISFLVFLFTESDVVRPWAAGVFAAGFVAMLWRHVWLSRRTRSKRSATP